MDPAKLSDNDFEVIEPLGAGAFSNVSLARYKKSGKLYALKKLTWTLSPERIASEVKWMMKLDHPNIVKLLCFYRKQDRVTLVLEYIPHVPFRQLLPTITPFQIKCYMYQLLIAISHLQSKRVIHRDIKPSNFLYNPETNSGKIIDCGLCEGDISLTPIVAANEEALTRMKNQKLKGKSLELLYQHASKGRSRMIGNRAGTRGFRAPEVLMAAWNQSSKIDVWSAGVILLCMLTRRYPFFKAGDDVVSLCEVASVVGSHRLELAALESTRMVQFPFTFKEYNLKDLVISLNPKIIEEDWDDQIFDLLKKLIEPVPSRRPSAREIVDHPFFEDIPDDLKLLPKE